MVEKKQSPKEIKRDEARYLFLKHIADMVDYWENESRRPDSKSKLEGLAFSILSMLDGCSVGLPGYYVVPMNTEEDKAYAQNEGFDWHRVPPDIIEEYDLGGSLHDEWHPYARKEVDRPENLFDFGAFLAEDAKKWAKFK